LVKMVVDGSGVSGYSLDAKGFGIPYDYRCIVHFIIKQADDAGLCGTNKGDLCNYAMVSKTL